MLKLKPLIITGVILLTIAAASVVSAQEESVCVTGGAVAADNAGLAQDCETLLGSLDTLRGTSTSLNWSATTPVRQWTGLLPRWIALTSDQHQAHAAKPRWQHPRRDGERREVGGLVAVLE